MKNVYILLITLLVSLPTAYSQTTNGQNDNAQTALSFLTIATDARAAGMGDMGVGTTADPYSHQYNPSKFLFGQLESGVTLSYSPWMRSLIADMSLSSIGFYHKIDTLQSISASFRYFAMGNMVFMDDFANPLGEKTAYQFAFDGAYARKLSPYLGASIAFRYALSDFYPASAGYKKGWGVAADISFYYQRNVTISAMPSKISVGTSVTNIGTKVSFRENQPGYYLPMMFRLGSSLKSELNKYNSLMLGAEIGRSLVPTRADKLDENALVGMFSSIGEGNVRSIAWALGAEYAYNNMIFGRLGYFHESRQFGQRQYLTFGLGLLYKAIHVDFAYLAPTGERHNAMANTVRISLAIDINK